MPTLPLKRQSSSHQGDIWQGIAVLGALIKEVNGVNGKGVKKTKQFTSFIIKLLTANESNTVSRFSLNRYIWLLAMPLIYNVDWI